MEERVARDAVSLPITRLAAARAALDSARRGWRGDIVVSAALDILAVRDLLTSSDLAKLINQLWGTESVTPELVASSLRVAERVYLVKEASGNAWSISEDARKDAEQDRAWADALLTEAREEFTLRLYSCCETKVKAERVPRLFETLIVALTAGAEGIYEAAFEAATPENLRPVRFDMARIGEFIKKEVQPKSVARAMLELTVAATDPEDDFGRDIVRLTMAGNILHGLLTRRDVPERVSLRGTRALLDTSFLIYAVEGRGSAQVFRTLITESTKAGVEVVVAEHTLDEWEALWQGGQEELGADEKAIGGSAYVLIGNPFVRTFLEQRERDPELSWARFQIGKRNIRALLEQNGIRVRRHGNDREEDKALARAVNDRLLSISRDPSRPGHRTRASAGADAQSCAMVARWREKDSGLPLGWFIATDTLTGQTYSELRPQDKYPLTVTAESWLLFLAHTSTEDRASLGPLARAISEVTARRAFLSVATGYTHFEALQISRVLSREEALSHEDLQLAVSLDFVGLVEEVEAAKTGSYDFLLKASDMLKRRAARADERAKRERERQSREKAQTQRELAEAKSRSEALEVQLEARNADVENELETLRTESGKYRRGFLATVGLIPIVALIVGLGASGVLTGWAMILAVAGTVIYVTLAVRYALDAKARLLSLIVGLLASAAWTLGALALEQLLTA